MISPKEFSHSEDQEALNNLEAIPGFTIAVKSFLRIGFEQYFHALNMASKIRLSPKQLPEIYQKLPPICKKLGIAEPEFYLEMDSTPNAYTSGDTKTFITITSGLIELLSKDELQSVIAHECGHIACRHVLYQTMAQLLKNGADHFGLLGTLSTPIQLGLHYWSRRSELSADRASAVVMGSPDPIINTLVRLSGGPKSITANIDINEFAAQAQSYNKHQENKWEKFLLSSNTAYQSHPYTTIRLRELMQWCKTDHYIDLCKNISLLENGSICIFCKKATDKNWNFCKHCGAKILKPEDNKNLLTQNPI